MEKAVQERKPVDVRADLIALLDSASGYLTVLHNKEKELLKQQTQLTRSPSARDDEMQEMPPEGSPNRRKVGCLIRKSKTYLFRTERWGASLLSKRKEPLLLPTLSIPLYNLA